MTDHDAGTDHDARTGDGARAGGFNLLTGLHADSEMAAIFSEAETVRAWVRVESALTQAQAEAGELTPQSAEAMLATIDRAEIDLPALWRGSRNVGYPILPLVRQLASGLEAGSAEQIHLGATTQDIMDTGLSLQLSSALDRMMEVTVAFGDALATLVAAHRMTPMAGRTHAQQAVPITFGAKIAVYLTQLVDMFEDLQRAKRSACRVSLFGAAGNASALGTSSAQVRSRIADRLGLEDADVPWHVARHRLADALHCSTQAATVAARFAREVIDLSRTEIREVAEQSGHLRGASSTMPQKENPISCEVIVGATAVLQSLGAAVFRMAEAGHERSAGEWQIEWYVVPEGMVLASTAVVLAAETAATLAVLPERMRENLHHNDLEILAEAYMIALSSELGRQAAHDAVYDATRRSRQEGRSLYETLILVLDSTHPHVQLAAIDPGDYLGESDAICTAALRDWAAANAPAERQ